LRDKDHLPPTAAWLINQLVPLAERDELLLDLASEWAECRRKRGELPAFVWLWAQLLWSLPALIRRTVWRGWTGFEPASSRMRPGGPMLETWLMDLRYSARRLTRRRMYAVTAVLTLALGAGGTAAIFSIVRAVLLEPLPVRDESRVVMFWSDGDWNENEFLFLRPQFTGFDDVAAYRPQDATLDVSGEPLRLIRGIATSAEFFKVLGTAALFGRTFQSGDDVVGGERAAVLSYRLWQDLGADRRIVGQQLPLGGVPHTIVGVMPPGFWFPSPEVRVWMTTPLSPERRSGQYTLVGRINAQSIEAMTQPIDAVTRALASQYTYPPQWDKTKNAELIPVREFLLGDLRPSLVAVMVAMALILGIACVNVAALMLGQLGGRSTEMSLRAALGAGRHRLVQQLVLESLLIGALAGLLGAAAAAVGFDALLRLLPLGALADTAVLDWTVFWSAIGFSLVAAATIAIVPGIAMWRTDLREGLSTSRTGGIGVRGGRLESALVVGQIALAVLLAAGAGLLMRSVGNLRAIDPGFRPEGLVVADATVPTLLTHDQRRHVILGALPALQAMPGVRSAAATMRAPLRGSAQNWGLSVPGRPDVSGTTTAFRVVTHDYFETLGIPIKRGRGFLPSDRENSERVVIINEALATKYFGGDDPVGQLVHTRFDDRGERIVGVIENVSESNLTDAATPARYMLYEHVPPVWHEVTFVVAAERAVDLPAVLEQTRTSLRRANGLALHQLTTMDSVFDLAVGAPQRVATLLTLLAALALVLGAVGIYGVIAHFVSRRTRDYGICIALGLPPQRVVSQVVSRGFALAAAGSVIGIVAVIVGARRLNTLLYEVTPADARALMSAVFVLLVIAMVASFLPAWRASRTDPATVLRQ
jgi:putative ABC transport system permease protein